MGLTPGSRLGAYEIVGLIGAGGMGEVYRATDTNLKRSVAIKVLPEALASDAERLARFQREAEVLAVLNHPNIAAIHGLERAPSTTALVMELVDGPTLAERIAHGPIPLDEALPIAKQIAEALEAAHEHGIIHRDLKPANIKVRPEGTVKVLDFGLAKAFTQDPLSSTPGLTNSPTITSPVGLTGVGVLLGTATYMSPEQAKGRTVDKRSDVWAFGAVLYEMLTARRAFEGDDVSDTLARILMKEPEWTALPATVPAAVVSVIRRCLQRDRKQRVRDIGDVSLALEGAFETSRAAPSVMVSRRREYAWAGLALSAPVIAGALALRGWGDAPPPRRTVRFEVTSPPGVVIDGFAAISPDGSRLAFAGASESGTLLWVRPLDTSIAQALMGTEGAARPFWSADSQSIGFFAQGKLKTIAPGGGPVVNVCNLSSTATYNGTWNQDDIILFAANDAGGPVFRVSSSGGQPAPATKLDASAKETRHGYPDFLPDGRHFAFWITGGARGGVAVGALDSDERHAIPGVTTEAKYSPTGHLLFHQNDSLVAQPFDLDRFQLSGDAINIAEQIGSGPLAAFSVSSRGDIVYRTNLLNSSLVWLDGTTGSETSRVGPQAEYRNPMLSPDGKFVAFERGTPSDIWIADLQRGTPRRFASEPGNELGPVWSPNGDAIAYLLTESPGTFDFYVRSVGIDEKPKKIATMSAASATITMDWSGNGDIQFGSGLDLWTLSSAGRRDRRDSHSAPAIVD